jgi:hypothetical protein
MAPLDAPLQPDALVALLYEVDQTLLKRDDGTTLVDLINRATERNLTTGELVVPEGFDPAEPPTDQAGGYPYQLHSFAYAVTGATAKARRAVSQLSDGQTPGMLGVGKDQISELVARVADRMARDTAEAES